MSNTDKEILEALKVIEKSFTRLTLELVDLNERLENLEDYVLNKYEGGDDEPRIYNPYSEEHRAS